MIRTHLYNLAQFVATIANGGKRIQPHVVKEIREPSEDGVQLGKISKGNDSEYFKYS